jgi:tetratricopeptide (TPR) repeat protein
MTVELDHNYLEAWTQLGCLLDQVGRVRASQESFRIAIDLHPEYPDAHFHLAELLERMSLCDEAAEHWRCYLKYDQRGPWAELARQRLDLAANSDPQVDSAE